ncbi:MAG TPA: nitronate monooxygenase [Alphaproteobacteria bacterium]|nr:nitronate monooxygenase [Alphaproteobacteria bacterium]
MPSTLSLIQRRAGQLGARFRQRTRFQISGLPLALAPSHFADVSKAIGRAALGARFLGCRYPVLGGAMTWVSEASLVAAISNAGGFGTLAAGALSPSDLDAEIERTYASTGAVFGVNLVTLNPEIDALLEVCLDRDVSHIVLGGGRPSAAQIARAKSGGAKVICFAASLQMGLRHLRNGADALIVEGHEAGGHVGPTSTLTLAQELSPLMDRVPVFVAGGIASGAAFRMFLALGAAGCQLGTVFACAQESRMHPNAKAAYLKASAHDAVLTPRLDPSLHIIPVRSLRNRAHDAFVALQKDVLAMVREGRISPSEAQHRIEGFWAGRLRRGVVDGDVEEGSLMAGQSVGLVDRSLPVSEIIESIIGN